MTIEVYLVRHGKTVFNTTGRVQGWSDSPLTEEGKEVARKLGHALREQVKFDAAFCSVSPRAVDTAKLILAAKEQQDLVLHIIEEVREYCFGGFEGELVSNIHQMVATHAHFVDVESWKQTYRYAERHLLAESVSVLDSLGLAETEAQFIGRLKKGMEQVVEHAPLNSKVLLVSHGMAITGILKSIDPHSILYQSVPNASVSKLMFDGKNWTIISVGEQLA